MQRTLEISSLSSNRLVFSSVRVNPSVRCLSLSSGKLSDNSSSDLDKLLVDTGSDNKLESLFEAKAPAPTSPTEVVEVDSAVFTDGASSLLSSAPVDPLLSLAEPPFTSLGLAHMWPSGWLQAALETLHIDIGNIVSNVLLTTRHTYVEFLGLPWWQAIAVTTLCMRACVFPIMVMAQRAMVNMNKHLPVTQKLQINAQMASLRGTTDEARFANKALNEYMFAENCHPAKTMWPIMAQGVFFTSAFFGIRGMCNAPVESLTTGGLAWFPNLAVADPTMILPCVTAATLFLQIHLGADGINTETMPPIMRKLMYIMPLVSIPVMINFPAALNVYWLTNNVISLVQSRVIKRPAVRERLGIGEMIKWKPEDLPMTNFYVSVDTFTTRDYITVSN